MPGTERPSAYAVLTWHNVRLLPGLIRHHTLSNTITILPGDFLAPSLLSSLDKGKGMVDCMNKVPRP
eukprot:787443-Rhodomonas_salina.2